jgi:hypothetical protein
MFLPRRAEKIIIFSPQDASRNYSKNNYDKNPVEMKN